MTPFETVDCYDYPQYWDVSFLDETELECDFFEDVFKRFGQGETRRILDVGCGGGRNVLEMAARDFEVIGLDNSEPSLAYLSDKLLEKGLTAETMLADMADFESSSPIDAALCTFNTFRHLLTEEEAESHLHSVARCLKTGGLYVLGFHILQDYDDPECEEHWTNRDGDVEVTTTLEVVQSCREERLETLLFHLQVRDGEKQLRLKAEYPYRIYNPTQFRSLLAKVPEFEICEVYDFNYDIDDPMPFDDEISDAVFVLRKK
ncbi:class I SAM-dependent methyltransferase [Bremerella sp. JC770]|uniref:class I SAM-dependent methyltransferase n=1 Tax=Bremerella sp. JC770 TaxID=3232137 RepID=UPI0034581231